MASSFESPFIPSAPVLASFGITRQEMDALIPILSDFTAGQVADVIWDAITDIGFDDVSEGVGIFFAHENSLYRSETDDSQTIVIFWDKEGPMNLPKKAFLQILELIAISTLSSPPKLPTETSMTDQEREHAQTMEEASRIRLRIALVILQKKISSNHSFDHSLSYRFSYDSGFDDSSNLAGLIQDSLCRWDHGVNINPHRRASDSTDPHVRRGVEGVLEGRSMAREQRGSINDRIRAKLTAVKAFTTKEGSAPNSQVVKLAKGRIKGTESVEEEKYVISLEQVEEGSAGSDEYIV